MDNFSILYSEARRAFESAEPIRASLTFQQAAECARNMGKDRHWYSAMVWAAESERHSGRYLDAQRLLLEALSRKPDGFSYEHWFIQAIRFKLVERWRPEKTILEAVITDIENIGDSNPVPQHVIRMFQGNLDALKGKWRSARDYFEESFLLCENESGGYIIGAIAEEAFATCIALKDFTAAENWLKAISPEPDTTGWEDELHARQDYCRLTLAQACAAPLKELKCLLRDFEESAWGVGYYKLFMRIRLARGRVALLDPECGDPGESMHIARLSCLKRLPIALDMIDRHNFSLLVLDIRLAALRYAAGLPLVDYEFAADKLFRDMPKPHLTAKDIPYRLHKAYAALRIANRHASHLDTILDCNWRQRDLEHRAGFLKTISKFMTGQL